MNHLQSGVLDQPGQLGETSSILKLQKLAGCGGVSLYSQLLGRLRQENLLDLGGGSCSEPRLCHCTSAWGTERDSVSKKKKNKKPKNKKQTKENPNYLLLKVLKFKSKMLLCTWCLSLRIYSPHFSQRITVGSHCHNIIEMIATRFM